MTRTDSLFSIVCMFLMYNITHSNDIHLVNEPIITIQVQYQTLGDLQESLELALGAKLVAKQTVNCEVVK